MCLGEAELLDVVDLNKSCEEARGRHLNLSGVPIYYALCKDCGFCFAPQMCEWPREKFSALIYNESYVLVDPDYILERPQANAEYLLQLLGSSARGVRHLDFGGGQGLLSDLLRDSGWDSSSFDPFVDEQVEPATLGKFDLITAFEVFEHVPDVRHLVSELRRLIADNGVLLFSTLLSDGEIAPMKRLTWWYASPRNGHISLHSQRSLTRLVSDSGFALHSFTPNLHVCWRTAPAWAHFLPKQGSV